MNRQRTTLAATTLLLLPSIGLIAWMLRDGDEIAPRSIACTTEARAGERSERSGTPLTTASISCPGERGALARPAGTSSGTTNLEPSRGSSADMCESGERTIVPGPTADPPPAARATAASEALLGELSDPDASVRRDALAALGEEGLGLDEAADDDAVVARVNELARADADPDVRRHASRLLALGDAREHEATLIQLVADADPGVRANACLGLARAGDGVAESRLIGLAAASTGIALALEAPELRGPEVLAWFEKRASDRELDPRARAHAQDVLDAKRAALGAN